MPLTHAHLWAALDALAARVGTSPSGLARRAGLDATSFNPSKRIAANGRPRWPSTENLARVLEVTNLSLAEFSAFARETPAPSRIPLLGLAQAGQDGFFDDAGLPLAEGWEQTDLPTTKDSLLSLEIAGDSMVPVYRPGDKVIVDREATAVRKGDRVVVRTLSGETLAKEVSALTARTVTLASINPDYPPRAVPRRDIAWMGRIVWASQ